MNVTGLEKGIEMITKSYMVGLPDSGKTTFLGALGYYILNDDEKEGTFEIDTIENMDYIRKLSETWAQCQVMERTIVDYFVNNRLLLKDKLGNRIELQIPDQSGEVFKRNVEGRSLKEDMLRDLQECSIIFLFLNPVKMSPIICIKDIPEELRESESEELGEIKKFSMQDQVKYIVMLQDIYAVRKQKTKIKIIVSAWDNHMEKNVSPEELLKEEVPLLWQFLESNQMKFECEYWGVSAQGGDLDDEKERDKLQDVNNAIDRIIVVDNEKKISNDITAILR